MKKTSFLLLLVYIFNTNVYSQNKMLTGRVINDYSEVCPFVSILTEDNIELGKTDIEGFFKIDVPISAKKILFKSLGLETTKIELIDNCENLEVIMMLSGTYDFVSLKKINKIRKKTFKKLSKLHVKLYNNGVFKTKIPCYIHEFEYY